jgi:FkbM family methyltransferase
MKLPRWLYLNWLRVTWWLRDTFGLKTYGIGWTAARVGVAFDFTFRDVPFRFLPSAARSYCLLPAGIPNEPETHQFIERVLDAGVGNVIFVEVGASVGEFAIPMAYDSRVARVVAFEPHPATADALRASAAWAPAGKIEIIQKGVAESTGFASFALNERAPTGAGLRETADGQDSMKVDLCTLDEIFKLPPDQALILLIDIEGGELDAMRGGMSLITRQQPLIIFEYNATTRRSFQLGEAAALLGPDYEIYRLRSSDGRLDSDFSETWNVVALPRRGLWAILRDEQGLIVS